MATISSWTPFGVAIDITATGSNVSRISATDFTVNIDASWKTTWGATTNYQMDVSSGNNSITINSWGNYASNGSGSFVGKYSISGNSGATKTITVTFTNSGASGSSSKDVAFDVWVPAYTPETIMYTISYNANGGIGAPSAQTKTHGQTLALSSVVPTRDGYTFLGWGRFPDAMVSWYAGGYLDHNASTTLYAIWSLNTYTITYDGNGGSCVPIPQIRKGTDDGVPITSIVPFKVGYTFKGWATSLSDANSGIVSYTSGNVYSADEDVTLYASWEAYETNGLMKTLNGHEVCDQAARDLFDTKVDAVHTHAPSDVDAVADEDTGWIDLYNVTDAYVKARRKNGIVYVVGLSQGALTISADTYLLAATLPEGMRPPHNWEFNFHGHGSPSYKKRGIIYIDGEIKMYEKEECAWWGFSTEFPTI